MLRSLLTSASYTDVMSAGGVYLGRALSYDVDFERVNRVVGRCVQGLYFREFRRLVPDGYFACGLTEPPRGSLETSVAQAVLNTPARTAADGAFQYWIGGAVDEPLSVCCVMAFFEGIVALGFVLPDDAKSAGAQRSGV
jgi:hypothetical protein